MSEGGEPYELTAGEIAIATGGRVVTDYDDSPEGRAEVEERRKAILRAVADIERDKQRERRREETRQRAVVKRALKADLPVRRAPIGGVEMELGAASGSPVAGNELDKWLLRHPDYARPS